MTAITSSAASETERARKRGGGDRGAAAVALHAPDDRLAHAAPVGGHRGRIEAGAAVADVDLHLAVGDLGVDVDGRAAAELRRIDHRLARSGDQRAPALVEIG